MDTGGKAPAPGRGAAPSWPGPGRAVPLTHLQRDSLALPGCHRFILNVTTHAAMASGRHLSIVCPRDHPSPSSPARSWHTRKSAKPTGPIGGFPRASKWPSDTPPNWRVGRDQPDAGSLPNPGSIHYKDARHAAGGPELSSPCLLAAGRHARGQACTFKAWGMWRQRTTGTTSTVTDRRANVEAFGTPKSPLKCQPPCLRKVPQCQGEIRRHRAHAPQQNHLPQGRGAARTDHLSKSGVLIFLSQKAKPLWPFCGPGCTCETGPPSSMATKHHRVGWGWLRDVLGESCAFSELH